MCGTHLGSVLTGSGYFTMKIKMRIAMAKEGFDRKISSETLNSGRNLLVVIFEVLHCLNQRPGH
jgi:hypothetical protein